MNILITFLFLFNAYSQTLSVKELIQKGMDFSPELKASGFKTNSSEFLVKQSRVFANPIISFQGGSLKSATESGAVKDFTLAWPLPWPGKRKARMATQDFLYEVSKLDQTQVKLQLGHRIYVMSAELSALQELESHYAERKRRFSLIQKSLRSRPLASPKQQVDRDLIESQINLLEKGMIDLLARKEALRSELKILTDTDFKKVNFSWEVLPSPLDREVCIKAIENGPLYKKLDVQTQIADNRIEEARLEARPDIVLGANYREERLAPINHFYHGMISVVIPIIDQGYYNMQAARSEKKRTLAMRDVEINFLLSLVHQYYSEYEASKKAIEIFNLKNLSTMEKKFIDAERSFRKGFIDALTFLQIDFQIHENIDQIYLSRIAYVNSVSNLNLLIGKGPLI